MAFVVQDFEDLLRLLDQHPEWQSELRRRIVPDTFLELPESVRQLTAAQGRTEQRLEELAAAQGRTEQRLEELAAAQARTEQRLEELAAAQARTEQRLDALTAQVASLAAAVDRLVEQVRPVLTKIAAHDGRLLEMDYRERAASYLTEVARRLRVVNPSVLADLLDDGVDQGRLTEAERQDVMWADLVCSGRRRTDEAEIRILAEVSVTVDPHDVERAIRRAEILARLGLPVVPLVGGEGITADARRLAADHDVWVVLDGRGSLAGGR